MLEHFFAPDNAKLMREVIGYLAPYKLMPAAMFGVLFLYGLNRWQRKQPFSALGVCGVDLVKATPLIVFCDLTLSSIVGGIFVFLMTDPTTAKQAIASGLGLTGLLSTYTKSLEKDTTQTVKQKALLRETPDAGARKSARRAGWVCLISGLIAIIFGAWLTTWAPIIGSIVAILAGAISIIAIWVYLTKEQAFDKR
jgi:hypothetical protein